jgi:hypothetical protein
LRESADSHLIGKDQRDAGAGRPGQHSLRGGYTDPYNQGDFDPPEPGLATVLAWSGVAALALVIAFGALVFGLPATPDTGPAADDGGVVARSDFAMLAAPGGSDQDLAALRIENAALRQSVQTLRSTVDGLTGRLGELELRFGSVTGSVTPPPKPVRTVSLTPEPAPPVEGSGPLPTDATGVRRTAFGLELGVFADLGSARIAWRRMTELAPDVFADLEPVANVRDRDGRLELLLVAGPFATADDAAARCAQAEAQALACLPAFYVGQPLAVR